MNKHALVVGSQTHGLQGAVGDASRMDAALREAGFKTELRLDGAATRDGILEGYDQLIAKVSPEDAAVVYYAGHGVYGFNTDASDAIRTMQAIVPSDFDAGSAADFRGITSWELSIKLAQLTARTRNVTLIFDCCHASQMSRDGAARQAMPRALPHPVHLGFREHIAALERRYGKVELDPIGNRDAVRLVACSQSESAFEYLNGKGMWGGAFTEALLEVLREVGDASVDWAAVGSAVRERVLRTFMTQRPDVEGPAERRLFSLLTADREGGVPVSEQDGLLRIQAGELLGTKSGDIYGVVPLGVAAYDEARAIASIRIDDVKPLSALGTATWLNGHRALPRDAVAFPLERAASTWPIALIAPDSERARLAAAIVAAKTLRVVDPAAPTPPLVTLRLAGGALTIEDSAGPMFPPTTDPRELGETIKNLANLGVAQGVRELVGIQGLSATPLEITWGVVENGEPRPMPDQGAGLGLGDRIYVKVRSTSVEPRYVHIFNVGVRGKVTLLTKYIAPAGVCLDSTNREVTLGERDGKLLGLPLSWPKGLPQNEFPRTDELFVFVTAQPVSLANLETQEYAVRGVKGAARGSKLQEMLAQLQDGLTRDVGDPEPIEDFLVKRFAYQLYPRKGAIADTLSFQVDENPGQLASSRSPDAWLARGRGDRVPATTQRAEPGAISIRLDDLVVERNRAVFNADIRIDALVCTRSAKHAETFTAHTMRFQGIKDGQRLPLEHARIFHGPVREFVDVCLWVSRDTTHDRDLVELFARQTNSPQFQDAATALLATTDVAAGPWIAAVGAGAVLARMAYDLILKVENKTIGLYRTSFLASESFGVGQHPVKGLYRAQDFSFSMRIDAV